MLLSPCSSRGTRQDYQKHFTQTCSGGYPFSVYSTARCIWPGTLSSTCMSMHVILAGAFYEGEWAYSVFQTDLPAAAKLHISYKEVWAVVQVVRLWAPCWRSRSVVFHTDSTVTQAIINKGRSKNPYVNSLLRKLAWECAMINCRISAVHVAGSFNIMADSVSRLHEGKINELVQLLSYYHLGRQPVIERNQHMSKSALFLLSVQVQEHPA